MDPQVVCLNGRLYNYVVDGPGRRIWLEDNDSKRQWQWLGAEAKPVEGEDIIPVAVALAALQRLFYTGSGKYCVDFVEANKDGLLLTLRLPVRDTSWIVTRPFELVPIALDDAQLTRALTQEMRKTLAAIQDQLTTAQGRLQDAQKTQMESQKVLAKILKSIELTAVLVILVVVLYAVYVVVTTIVRSVLG